MQATLSSPCRACLVSHPWQLVPYAALGLGRDGANNLASSCLESWALDDSSVEKMRYSVLDSTKWSLVSGLFYWSLVCFVVFSYPVYASILLASYPAIVWFCPTIWGSREIARTRFFRFARKFNSDLCVAAPYVQVRTKRRLRCPDQPDTRPNPNPSPNPNPNPNPNPDPNPTLWGTRGLLSRSAGAVLSLCANLKTLHAIKRLVHNLWPNNNKLYMPPQNSIHYQVPFLWK